ncbi:DMT family transporter [Aureimonas sp. ME7]|uniref:DMT family transporter n=1 Tax=Aureimonas sp. ME7 TaxID=2744252 RepID=UPI001FCF24B5|nr:DMT family transporter [Aureimonas sp. ME7]
MRPPSRTPRLLPSILGVAGIVLWASETVLITFTTEIPPLETVGLAFVFAALLSPLVWWITGDDPRAAFRQPPRVWIVTVGSLVAYHACIYYATQKAPPAAAALLQGTTPLIIVLGSALLPGERLRWWHLIGAGLGFAGILLLIDGGGEAASQFADAGFYLAVIGVSAALWGGYSILSRSFGDVPSSALGVFYAASAVLSLGLHVSLEEWVAPSAADWWAIALLGTLPMGLALYFWDYGVKRGDIQALGAISYVEPFIGAALVAMVGQGELSWTLALAGLLVVAGGVVGSCGLFERAPAAALASPVLTPGGREEIEAELLAVSLRLIELSAAGARCPETDRLVARTLIAWRVLDAEAVQRNFETAS